MRRAFGILCILIFALSVTASPQMIGSSIIFTSYDLDLNKLSEFSLKSDLLRGYPLEECDYGLLFYSDKDNTLERIQIDSNGIITNYTSSQFKVNSDLYESLINDRTIDLVEIKKDSILFLEHENIREGNFTLLEINENLEVEQSSFVLNSLDLNWSVTEYVTSLRVSDGALVILLESIGSVSSFTHSIVKYEPTTGSTSKLSVASYESVDPDRIDSKLLIEKDDTFVFLHTGFDGSELEIFSFNEISSSSMDIDIASHSFLLGFLSENLIVIQDRKNANWETVAGTEGLRPSSFPEYMISTLNITSQEKKDLGPLPSMNSGFLIGEFLIHTDFRGIYDSLDLTVDPIFMQFSIFPIGVIIWMRRKSKF